MFIPEWIIVGLAVWLGLSALPYVLREWSAMHSLNKYCDEIERRMREEEA